MIRGQIGFALTDGVLSEPEDLTWIAPDRPAKQCRECGRILPDLCFRVAHRHSTVQRHRHSRCVACEQRAKDEWKRAHRYTDKAKRNLNAHRRKERRQGLHDATTLAEYELATGITVADLARAMERTYESDAVCPHCAVPWTDMPNGLADMSVDRVDRTALLTWSNLLLICRTGNSQKGVTVGRTWEVRQAYFRILRQHAA